MSNPQQAVKDDMAGMAQNHLEKCYSVNALAKNDCAKGAHSCVGPATQARDAKSTVLLPAGDCGNIAGVQFLAPAGATRASLVDGGVRRRRNCLQCYKKVRACVVALPGVD
jgi:uncharacterized membrane protein